jgi:hypothetical protein
MYQAPNRSIPRRRFLAVPLALAAGALLLAACTGSSAPASTTASGAAPATSAVAASPAAAAQASPAASSAKVSANDASIAELQQAFEAAGIPSAARWAREVDEYRPYPTNDPGFAKLRQELSKYNPSPDVLEKIVATLSLT